MTMVRKSDDGTDRPEKPEECDGCHFETPLLTRYYEDFCHEGRHVSWLCRLCANTTTGNAVRWPEQYGHKDLLKTICYVGNVLLEAVTPKEDA